MMNLFLNFLASAPAEAATAASVDFHPENFVANLQYMGIGMLVIFAIIGVIILATVAINKLFSGKK